MVTFRLKTARNLGMITCSLGKKAIYAKLAFFDFEKTPLNQCQSFIDSRFQIPDNR